MAKPSTGSLVDLAVVEELGECAPGRTFGKPLLLSHATVLSPLEGGCEKPFDRVVFPAIRPASERIDRLISLFRDICDAVVDQRSDEREERSEVHHLIEKVSRIPTRHDYLENVDRRRRWALDEEYR